MNDSGNQVTISYSNLLLGLQVVRYLSVHLDHCGSQLETYGCGCHKTIHSLYYCLSQLDHSSGDYSIHKTLAPILHYISDV